MAAAPRHTRQAQRGSGQQSRPAPTSQKKAGRPKGPPSTIVNLRIPLDLLAQLDRYIDRLEVQTGLKANRGMGSVPVELVSVILSQALQGIHESHQLN